MAPKSPKFLLAPMALVLAIGIWSFSPLLVRGFKGVASPQVAAAIVINSALFTALVLATVFDKSAIAAAAKYLRFALFTKRTWPLLLMAVCAFVFYPILYFRGIQEGDAIISNIINYLWPVLAAVFATLLRKATITVEALLSVGAGLCGAMFALRSWTAQFSVSNVEPYLLAFAGALFYGFYSGLASWRSQTTPAGEESLSTQAQLLVVLLLACVLHLLFFVFSLVTGRFQEYALVFDTIDSKVSFLCYAMLFSVAHFAWLFAVQRRSEIAWPSAYMTPIASTVLLGYPDFAAVPWAHGVVPGLICVIVGIRLAQYKHGNAITPLDATLALVCMAWAFGSNSAESAPQMRSLDEKAVAYVTLQVNVIQTLLALFAIFGAFTLTNAIGRYRGLRVAFALFFLRARRAQDVMLNSGSGEAPVRNVVRAVIDQVFFEDKDHFFPKLMSTKKEFDELRKSVPNGSPLTDGGHSVFDELVDSWNEITQLTRIGVSPFEWVILVTLAAIMVALAYKVEVGGAEFLLLRVGLVGALALILFAIRDFNNGCPAKAMEFTILTQASANFSPPFQISEYTKELSEFGGGVWNTRENAVELGTSKSVPVQWCDRNGKLRDGIAFNAPSKVFRLNRLAGFLVAALVFIMIGFVN